MLPDEVRKAVERWDSYLHARATSLSVTATPTLHEWQTIRAHLLAREAELTELRREMDDYNAIESALEDAVATSNKHRDRAERAEALLREALPYCDTFPDLLRDGGDELRSRITAHLSENSRG